MKKTLVTVACAVATVVTLSVLPVMPKFGPFGVDVVSAATGETTTTSTSTTKTSTSSSTSSSDITGTLKLGSKGANVRTLQTFLNNGGYSLKVDGDFGKLTLAAVKDFQGKNGLTADGIVGQSTRAKMNGIIAASAVANTTATTAPTLKVGANGSAVTALQTALNKNGYSLKVDGVFGQATLNAVKSYQKAKGLSADGIVGPKTNAALFPASVPTTTTPTTTTPTTPDVVTSASVTDKEAVFEKTIGTTGTWIIATTKDLTFDHAITVDGNFWNKKTVKDASGYDVKQIARKIALYTQDDKRNVTARFTLTAPKITILSINASIQHGTVKGDIYVSAPNFQLVDTVVEGNVYFTNKGAQDTFKMDAQSYVRGKKEAKFLPETTIEGVDAYTSASKVIANDAFEKAISSTPEAGGKWIIATLDNLTFNKELVVDGEYKDTKTPPNQARKLAIYAHDVNNSKLTTGRFILTAPKLTIKSSYANITKGMFKGDVYVEALNFKLVDAVIDGNLYFKTQEQMDSFKKLTDATSIVTGRTEVRAN